MVNEEDHLRIQVMLSGFRLPDVWERDQPRSTTSSKSDLAYAFSPQLGYLTACPTNVGTGIRVGVMLHLPALVPDQADRQGLPRPPQDQPGRPGPLRRGDPGVRRLLPDLQPADPRQERGGADPQPHRRRPPDHPVRAKGPPGPDHRAPPAPPRPGQPGLRRAQDGPDDLQRGDDAPALQRPHGDQPRPDRRPGDRRPSTSCSSTPSPPTFRSSRVGARGRRAQRRPGRLPPQPPRQRPAVEDG